MTGIKLNEDALQVFNDQKLKHQYQAIVFKLNDQRNEVIVEKTYEIGTPLEKIVEDLPPKDCRYVTYDFDFEKDGCQQNKLLFVYWGPETCPSRPKILYSATKRTCIEKMNGVQIEIQATTLDYFTREYFLEKCGGEK